MTSTIFSFLDDCLRYRKNNPADPDLALWLTTGTELARYRDETKPIGEDEISRATAVALRGNKVEWSRRGGFSRRAELISNNQSVKYILYRPSLLLPVACRTGPSGLFHDSLFVPSVILSLRFIITLLSCACCRRFHHRIHILTSPSLSSHRTISPFLVRQYGILRPPTEGRRIFPSAKEAPDPQSCHADSASRSGAHFVCCRIASACRLLQKRSATVKGAASVRGFETEYSPEATGYSGKDSQAALACATVIQR